MTSVLLLGAGFTRNWGGWLEREIEGDLLGRLADAPALRTLVQNSANFEEALGYSQLVLSASSSRPSTALIFVGA
jgi:hypothetical protein